jgi:hypothetical protein
MDTPPAPGRLSSLAAVAAAGVAVLVVRHDDGGAARNDEPVASRFAGSDGLGEDPDTALMATASPTTSCAELVGGDIVRRDDAQRRLGRHRNHPEIPRRAPARGQP